MKIRYFGALLLSILTGCASLSDRGAFSETKYKMPDGSNHTYVERTKVNIWVPSTHMINKYVEVCNESKPGFKAECKYIENGSPKLLAQDGPGTEIATELIRAGSLVGSTVYAADAAVDAAGAIGNGLANSGSSTNISNNTNVKGVSKAGAKSNSKAWSKSHSSSLSKSNSRANANSNSKSYARQNQKQGQRQRQGQRQNQSQHQKQRVNIKRVKPAQHSYQNSGQGRYSNP